MNDARRTTGIAALICVTLFVAGCATTPFGGSSSDKIDVSNWKAKAEADPTNPLPLFKIAEDHWNKGRRSNAETLLVQAVALDPGHFPSVSLLSQLYYESGRFEEGATLLERAQQVGGAPPEIYLALGLHYEALGDIEASDSIVQNVKPRVKDMKSGGSALAFLHLRGDDFQRSVLTARRVAEGAPTAKNYNNLGIAQLYANDPEAARESFVKAHRLDRDLPGPLYNLAIVDWFFWFEEERAREWFRRYRKLSNDDPDGLADILGAQSAMGGGR